MHYALVWFHIVYLPHLLRKGNFYLLITWLVFDVVYHTNCFIPCSLSIFQRTCGKTSITRHDCASFCYFPEGEFPQECKLFTLTVFCMLTDLNAYIVCVYYWHITCHYSCFILSVLDPSHRVFRRPKNYQC